MCKEHFIKHKTGYLTGLLIALLAVATLLLALAGVLGQGALNLVGDIGRIRVMPTSVQGLRDPSVRVIPDRVAPIGIQDPDIQRIAPDSGRIVPKY